MVRLGRPSQGYFEHQGEKGQVHPPLRVPAMHTAGREQNHTDESLSVFLSGVSCPGWFSQ